MSRCIVPSVAPKCVVLHPSALRRTQVCSVAPKCVARSVVVVVGLLLLLEGPVKDVEHQ